MKYLFYTLCISWVLQVNAQTSSKEIELPNGYKFLLGEISEDDLKTTNYSSWYNPNYDSYAVDKDLVKLFRKKLKNYQLLLFLGTWCGDSKREVPRIMKILDTAKFPKEQLKIVALDRRKDNYKKGPNGEEKGWNIKRVPTLIVLKDGKEVNRIIERPIDSLEEDLLAIVTKLTYTPNYSY